MSHGEVLEESMVTYPHHVCILFANPLLFNVAEDVTSFALLEFGTEP